MDSAVPFIPWHDAALWAEANASFKHSLQGRPDALRHCRDLAEALQKELTALFPLMDRLCQKTCPACTDVCCGRACVWIDFRDLLFLHLAGIPLPPGQLLGRRGERCRYNSPAGCRLERIQRPFVCTWYLCPAQTERLRNTPGRMQTVSQTLQRAKHLRREMETAFIRLVF